MVAGWASGPAVDEDDGLDLNKHFISVARELFYIKADPTHLCDITKCLFTELIVLEHTF